MKSVAPSNQANKSKGVPTIAELYPQLSPAEQEDAAYFLRRYLDLIKRIYERVEREKAERKMKNENQPESRSEQPADNGSLTE